jgi:hypothetical protein
MHTYTRTNCEPEKISSFSFLLNPSNITFLILVVLGGYCSAYGKLLCGRYPLLIACINRRFTSITNAS